MWQERIFERWEAGGELAEVAKNRYCKLDVRGDETVLALTRVFPKIPKNIPYPL